MIARSDSHNQTSGSENGEISHREIITELENVAGSAAFGKSERPARFLRHLVATALRGEAHILKESVIGTDVFGRPPSWDPRLDPIVRQEAARLRKRLAAYYENGGAADQVRIELPVGSYVPVFRRKAIEIEPEAIATPAATPVAAPLPVPVAEPAPLPKESIPARKRRVWPYAMAAILCIAVVVAAWQSSGRRESLPSIAVLPFANLTADPADQYFSDGLTDEITDSLSRLNTLRVIARSSALPFKGKPVDVREVGRLLNVTNVLEGSVERLEDRIKIVAHLERASDGSLLWSNTYERKASDLFAVQSELAAGIASSLGAAAGVPAAKHVPSAAAHESALKARYDTQQITPEALKRAETEYQHAIDLDPQYAAAYLGLAIAKYDEFVARGSAFQTEAERKSVEELYHKGLALDPDVPSAHATLAVLALQYDWDWGRAERELRSAVAGPSSAGAETSYAYFLIFRGRFAEADRHLQRSLDLDPFATPTMHNVALARNLEGRFAEAREIAQRMAAQYPNMIPPQQLIDMTYIEQGQPLLAVPIYQKLEPRFPQAQVFEAMAWAAAGQREKALRLMRPYEEKYTEAGVSMQWFALAYALMGDEPQTVKWLQRSADRHEWQALNLAVNPIFAPMRNSAGFRALEKRLGLN